MGSLDGHVAVVTGCGRMQGLGRGIALALARAGADLAVTDVRADGTRNLFEGDDPDAAAGWTGLDDLVGELKGLGSRALALVGDVGVRADAERMVAEAVGYFGQVDILVNNAAAPQGLDRDWTWNVPEEAWDEVMRVNTKGTLLMSAAVVRHLLDRGAPGRVINISSAAGRTGHPKHAAYCASKFAVIGLTQTMAMELADSGITVNAICPGSMDTARIAAAKVTGFPLPPVGRVGVPEDIARAVLFLAEPAAGFVTGESVGIWGGSFMF
jgi:3-oxoacyl-[acyl-carrier protein] reductase